jgi:hypothetical protein
MYKCTQVFFSDWCENALVFTLEHVEQIERSRACALLICKLDTNDVHERKMANTREIELPCLEYNNAIRVDRT